MSNENHKIKMNIPFVVPYWCAVNDKNGFYITTVIATCALCVFSALLSGCGIGFLLIGSYVLGFYLCKLSLKHNNKIRETVSSFISSCIEKRYATSPANVLLFVKSGEKDKRETDATERYTLMVATEVDKSVTALLNKVMDEYVSSWYDHMSSNMCFQYELKASLRKVLVLIIQRCWQVNVGDIVARKLLPLYLNHVEEHLKEMNLRQISHLHVAALSRQSEVSYLRNISSCILDRLLPSTSHCRLERSLMKDVVSNWVLLPLSDAVCNPANLRVLFLRYLNGGFNIAKMCDTNNDHTSSHVEFLQEFVCQQRNSKSTTKLLPDLNQILRDDSLSAAFMKFLKDRKSAHLLQFCLDVDEFNERMLKPDVSTEEMDMLYKDAWDIYSIYFSINSPQHIEFVNDLPSMLCKVLSKDVTKLRTSSVLYEAYEHVYTLLERRYCAEFHESDEFFNWIYGRSDSAFSNVSDSSTPTCSHSPVKGSFGRRTVQEITNKLNKLKDALKSNSSVMEGQMFDDDCRPAECYIPRLTTDDELEEEDIKMGKVIRERDLSSWKVAIPTVGTRNDPATNKPYTVFVIHVQNENDAEDEWLIERRPVEFYTMDSKLVEFHGSFQDVQLPPKPRIFKESSCTENIEFFETYLNKLLKNSALKRSELLYSFLKCPDDFEEEFNGNANPTAVPIMRKPPGVVHVPAKKERGQHLDSFIQSYILGNEDTKRKTSKYDSRDFVCAYGSPSVLNSELYGDNFGINVDICTFSQQIFLNNEKAAAIRNEGLLDTPSKCLIYLALKSKALSDGFIRLLLIVNVLLGSIIDIVIKYVISKFLKETLTAPNVAYLVDYLRWSIFDSKDDATREDAELSLIKALDERKASFLYPVYTSIYQSVQNPVTNKQLYYQMFDAVLEELFPEMVSPSE